MKICCVSDLHGNLPKIPECDLLIIAGDICPHFAYPVGSDKDVIEQSIWFSTKFSAWLKIQPAKETVACWGNHDFVGPAVPQVSSPMLQLATDKTVTVGQTKIYCSPWQKWYWDWAFNAPYNDNQEVFLHEKLDKIPDDTDIIVSHGPVLGYGDRVGTENTGSSALRDAVDRVQPKLLVCGHVHHGYGIYKRGETTIVHASLCDHRNELLRDPILLEI